MTRRQRLFMSKGDLKRARRETRKAAKAFHRLTLRTQCHDWDGWDDSMDGDAQSALSSAGFGTDEDYGGSGGDF